MEVKIEINSMYDLEKHLWSGGLDTYNEIWSANKLDQLEGVLNEIFCDRVPTITEINDLLWFDDELVKEMLGMNNEEEQELTLNESDIDIIEEQNELLGNYLRERLKGNVTPYLSTTINDIEEDCGIELSDEEKEMLIDLG